MEPLHDSLLSADSKNSAPYGPIVYGAEAQERRTNKIHSFSGHKFTQQNIVLVMITPTEISVFFLSTQ